MAEELTVLKHRIEENFQSIKYFQLVPMFPFCLAVISGGRMIGVGIIKVVHTVQSWGGVDLESSKLMRMNI